MNDKIIILLGVSVFINIFFGFFLLNDSNDTESKNQEIVKITNKGESVQNQIKQAANKVITDEKYYQLVDSLKDDFTKVENSSTYTGYEKKIDNILEIYGEEEKIILAFGLLEKILKVKKGTNEIKNYIKEKDIQNKVDFINTMITSENNLRTEGIKKTIENKVFFIPIKDSLKKISSFEELENELNQSEINNYISTLYLIFDYLDINLSNQKTLIKEKYIEYLRKQLFSYNFKWHFNEIILLKNNSSNDFLKETYYEIIKDMKNDLSL